MKLSISNIAWKSEYDDEMYGYLESQGFSGLEIAPTRVFPDNPYDHLKDAQSFALKLHEHYGLEISSMQSIWYGRSECIFGTSKDRRLLIDYTKKAIDFAAMLSCGNLVFGCPKNRNIPEGFADYKQIAIDFFYEIAGYAEAAGTVIALEPNPSIYGTNFINTTAEAFEFVKTLNIAGLRVNIDFGTIINNSEEFSNIADNIELVNHIHISEPNLTPITERGVHSEMRNLIYSRFLSIEMAAADNIETVKQIMRYVRGLLHNS